MTSNQLLGLALVAVVSMLIFTLGWHAGQRVLYRKTGRLVQAGQRARGPVLAYDQQAEQRAPWPTRDGWLAGTSWAGSQDGQYGLPRGTDPLELADAAYMLGHRRAEADQ